METNMLCLDLNPKQPSPLLMLNLETLKKVIVREAQGEKYLLFISENGAGWSYYPKMNDASITLLVHRIQETGMNALRKMIPMIHQKLVEKKAFGFIHFSFVEEKEKENM